MTPSAATPPLPVTAPLALEGVAKTRGEQLFSPVSLMLQEGEGIGVYGHNGCGKTTLLDIMAGLLRPTHGKVCRAGKIGYVMQHAGFQEQLSFKDNLLLEACLCGLSGAAAKRAAEQVAELCNILPFWKTRYSKGSSGMKGRLGVACALMGSPQLLLLDEAFNFLDEPAIRHLRLVLRAEKERGVALVMVSHDREDFAGLCERVLHLPDARIESL
ncbi:MAG: ABC transporter ATP-binding protein [Coriobacteriales bacterium]|nr:ABC transporter ATP-binding protein [Coriobacteriales bacterium]